MATRSTIAIEYPDGTVHQVYCHWDGYLENNGEILFHHYADPAKTAELVSLGDISSLGEEIHPKGEHSWEEPETGVTVFYGRDRGEAGVEYRVYANYNHYVATRQSEEYNYIQRSNGEWFVCPMGDSVYEKLGHALRNLA